MKRVMVFITGATDVAKVKAELTNIAETDGYIVGDATDAAIARLEKRHVVSIVEAAPPATTTFDPGFGVTSFADATARAPLDPTPQLPDPPGYYLGWIQKPILPEYHERLEAVGLKPQGTRDNRLVFRIDTHDQLVQLQALDFITNVTEYDEAETLKPQQNNRAPATHWDLVLHHGASAAALRKQLDADGVKVVKQTKNKIQIRAGKKEAEACAGYIEVAAVLPWRTPKMSLDHSRALVGLARPMTFPKGDLTGKGVIVGVCDSGLDATHVAFKAKKPTVIARARKKDGSDPHGHGTHVAGTICGLPPKDRPDLAGIAPGAKLVFQSVMDEDGNLTGLKSDVYGVLAEAYKKGVRIHNNSWGADREGAYDASSIEVDRFVWDHPDMLVVIAAGNAGTTRDPRVGERRSLRGEVEWSSLNAPGTAQNALVVGASRSSRKDGGWAKLTHQIVWPDRFSPPARMANDTVSGDPDAIAPFSSRGLVDDQRLKPDLVAPGTDIAAPRAKTAPGYNFAGVVPGTKRTYGFMSGTSMATPIVAGCAALLREYLQRDRGVDRPSAALMRAILVNGTRRLRGPGSEMQPPALPNPHQGFGRLDFGLCVPIDGSFVLAFHDTWPDGAPFVFGDRRITRSFTFTTTTAAPLRVTLAYTDPPLNNNDVSFLLERPGIEKPLFGNSELVTVLRAQPPDALNNVESVKLEDAPAATWTITVIAKTVVMGPQHFAIAVAGALASDELQGP